MDKKSYSKSIHDLVCERKEGKMQIATGNDRVEQQDILRRNETERVGGGGVKGKRESLAYYLNHRAE